MLIRTCYSQYSLPKQLVKFSQQVTEILPKFPHLLKNIRPVFFTEKYTQIQLWGCCNLGLYHPPLMQNGNRNYHHIYSADANCIKWKIFFKPSRNPLEWTVIRNFLSCDT